MTTITTDRIESLATAAAENGDLLQAAICAVALGRDTDRIALDATERAYVESMTTERAIAECARVIRNTEAQE